MARRRRFFPWLDDILPEEEQEHSHADELPADEGDPAGIGEQPWQAPHPPAAAPPPEPLRGYHSSDEHLWDELCYVEQLVRAHTERWRRTLGENKPERLWGMIHVTAAEVQAYLDNDCQLPDRLPPDIEQVLQPYLEEATRKAHEIAARRGLTAPELLPQLRVDQLKDIFGLTQLQRNILLICLLPELDGRYRRLYGYLQDDASRTRPTVELALQILHPTLPSLRAGRDAFDARAPLLRYSMLSLESAIQTDEPLPMRSLRIDDRIANYLLGSDLQDGRLEDILTQSYRLVSIWEQIIAPSEHIYRLQALAAWWARTRATRNAGMTALLYGPYGSGRQLAAQAICTETGTPLLLANLPAAARSPLGYHLIVDLCYREAALRGAALFWSGCEQLIEAEGQAHHWDYLVSAAERFAGLTFLSSEIAWDPSGRFRERSFARVPFPAPGYELRCKLWSHYLGLALPIGEPQISRADLVEQLANGFQFTEGQIVDALTTAGELARQRSPYQPLLTLDDLFEGCRRQSSRHLNTFAQRVSPGTDLTFDDLILPEANLRQLHELRERIHNRGRVYTDLGFERRLSLGKGIIALFTGSSGTGKTLAATLIASEQRVDLYKVDLSAVVSKYIGETEKNLNRVFSEAEDTNAIIFFDEADALFGKRGKVEEARDRWANMEVNYLLQRLEAYEGVVILATNLRQNMDDAFLRRIHVAVDFPFPDALARGGIWRGMFPRGVEPPPPEQIADLAAQLPLSGGSIRNIVLDATFRALARQGDHPEHKTVITLRDLILGTAREYQKQGRPLTIGEFGEQFYEWIEEDILLTPAPDEGRRLRDWRAAFPADVVSPQREEVSALAERFVLRPYMVRSIVGDAVHMASGAGCRDPRGYIVVSQRRLVRAIADEYRRQGRPVSEAEFGKQFYAWATEAEPAASIVE